MLCLSTNVINSKVCCWHDNSLEKSSVLILRMFLKDNIKVLENLGEKIPFTNFESL